MEVPAALPFLVVGASVGVYPTRGIQRGSCEKETPFIPRQYQAQSQLQTPLPQYLYEVGAPAPAICGAETSPYRSEGEDLKTSHAALGGGWGREGLAPLPPSTPLPSPFSPSVWQDSPAPRQSDRIPTTTTTSQLCLGADSALFHTLLPSPSPRPLTWRGAKAQRGLAFTQGHPAGQGAELGL